MIQFDVKKHSHVSAVNINSVDIEILECEYVGFAILGEV